MVKAKSAQTLREQAISERQMTASSTPPHIMVVEDEKDLRDLLRYNLEREHYRVTCTDRAERALHGLGTDRPDLVVLDLMLPGMQGLELCRTLKADPLTKAMPIVILTARSEEADIVVGLEMGADDYVTKPFSPRILLARIRAVLRRGEDAGEDTPDGLIRHDDLMIDPTRMVVEVADESVDLTHTEFSLLHALARRPGRVYTRDQLIQATRGMNTVVTGRSVDVHVMSLRRKLGAASKYLQTVRGVGYRFKDN